MAPLSGADGYASARMRHDDDPTTGFTASVSERARGGSAWEIPPTSPRLEGSSQLRSPRMIGRERELGQLIEAVTRVPALVVVEGESGVGKTRLVEELLATPELAGWQHLVGECYELSESFPFGPLLEAVQQARLPPALPAVTGALRTLLPELTDTLPPALPALAEAGAERHRLFRGLRALLAAVGRGVLLLEDLHWADEATMGFLRYLVRHLPPELAVVCTYRREDLPDGSRVRSLDARLPADHTAVRIALEPLDRDHVRELVGTILGNPTVPQTLADYLCGRTAGLPFAIEETLLLLNQRPDIVRQHTGLARQQLRNLTVPPKLRDAISERFARLGPPARAVVHAAAVLAIPADDQSLARISGLSDAVCADALTEALAAAILFDTGDGRYGFRHSLARQAIDEGIPTPLRRRLHLSAASVLERGVERPLARLAHHYRAAGDTAKWVRYAQAAASRATSLDDHATAYALLRDAVGIPTMSAGRRGWLAVQLIRHAARCGAQDDAIGLLRPLLDDETVPRRLRGRIRYGLGRLLHDTGESYVGRSEVVRALDDVDRRTAAQAMAWLALLPSGTDSLPARLEWLDRAQATAAQSHDRAMRIEIAASRAVLLVCVADSQCWQAIRSFPEHGDDPAEIEQIIRGYGNMADSLLHIGHYGHAAELNMQAMQLASKHSPSFATNFELTRMQLDWLTGRWDDLEQQLRDLIEAVEDLPWATRYCEAFLGLLLLAQGRIHDSLALLEPLADKFDEDSRVQTWVAAGIAQARLAQRRPSDATDAVQAALRVIKAHGIWLCAGDVAIAGVTALLAVGQRRDAADLVANLDAAVRGRDAPAAQAASAMCQGLLAEDDQGPQLAARHYLRAARLWQALPRPYEAAKARARAGACLVPLEAERGRDLLRESLATFCELDAQWDVRRVRQILRRNGLLPPHSRGRRSYGLQLSPREEEVARLAAEGLHNREIAQTLHLAIKTVESHLSSVIRKLGANPRTEPAPRPRSSDI